MEHLCPAGLSRNRVGLGLNIADLIGLSSNLIGHGLNIAELIGLAQGWNIFDLPDSACQTRLTDSARRSSLKMKHLSHVGLGMDLVGVRLLIAGLIGLGSNLIGLGLNSAELIGLGSKVIAQQHVDMPNSGWSRQKHHRPHWTRLEPDWTGLVLNIADLIGLDSNVIA